MINYANLRYASDLSGEEKDRLYLFQAKNHLVMEERKPKILLAEDDTNLGMVLKNYLELNDYEVELCRDGILALAAFRREKFDICLLDIMMPNMDGFKLAEEIRDVDPDIPFSSFPPKP